MSPTKNQRRTRAARGTTPPNPVTETKRERVLGLIDVLLQRDDVSALECMVEDLAFLERPQLVALLLDVAKRGHEDALDILDASATRCVVQLAMWRLHDRLDAALSTERDRDVIIGEEVARRMHELADTLDAAPTEECTVLRPSLRPSPARLPVGGAA